MNVDPQDITLKGPEFYAQFDITIATDLDFNAMSRMNASTRLSNRPFYAAGAHGFYGYIFADLISHEYVIERDKSNVPTMLKQESATRAIIAATTKKENGRNIEMVTKRETYSPLLLANTSMLPPEYLKNRRKLRQVSPLLTCMRALWEFEKTESRCPSQNSHSDLALFTRLATDRHKELQIPIETLKSEFLRSFLENLGSELAPVTAFLGGQLAQDIINVLGQREQPIQNFMFFDGDESKGPVYPLHPESFDENGVPPVPLA